MARLYIASDVPRQRGLKRRPLGTLLSLPDAVRPRGCQPLEPWPKAGLPLEQAVRGITPDTPHRPERAALQIPAQGVLPLDAAIHPLPGLPPSIDRFCGNGTGCPREVILAVAKIFSADCICPLASG